MKSLKFKVKILAVVIAAVVTAGPVQADYYDEGLVAWSKSDYPSAVNLFMQAVAAGETGAEHMLARIYAEKSPGGDEKSQTDRISAFEWSRSAAEKGMVQAQFEVAGRYERGDGTTRNVQAASQWYRKAASQGHHLASLRLAEMIERGDAIPVESGEAERLFVYAASELDVYAQKGDARSQTVLAGLFERGQGVQRSMLMAAAWYTKAALQNYAAAEYRLGRLYAGVDGVDRNLAEAAYWLDRAARQGEADAKALLAVLKNGDDPALALGSP